MEATFRGNHKTTVYLNCNGYYRTEHTRYRNMEATLRGNHEIIVYPSCNGPF